MMETGKKLNFYRLGPVSYTHLNMSNRVYRKLEQKLRTERERRGLV